MSKSLVAVNDQGRRIGESHPRAKLTNHEVDLVHELVEEGMSYRQVAEKFEGLISKAGVGHIVTGRCRGGTVAGHRLHDPREPAYDPQHANRRTKARPPRP
jgi:hypothetical protein